MMNIKEVASIAESYREDFCKASKSLRRAKKLLREIYGMRGPRDGGRLLPPHKFAKMTRGTVNAIYDFPERDRMHAIAKLLSE